MFLLSIVKLVGLLSFLAIFSAVVRSKDLRGAALSVQEREQNDDLFFLFDDDNNSTATNSTSKPKPKPAPRPLPVKPMPTPPPPPLPRESAVYESKLFPEDGTSYQRFGHSIAANDRWVAVGTSSASTVSKVYVFEERVNSSEWRLKGELSSNKLKYDGFGLALDLTTDFLAVGAPFDDSDGYSAGLVYVYGAAGKRRIDAKTVPLQVLRPTNAQKGASFGHSVSMHSNTLLIGSPGHTSASGKSAGAAYIFTQSNDSDRAWVQSVQLTDGGMGAPHDRFGFAVCVHGDTAVVSAVGYSGSVSGCGAVYVYRYTVHHDDEHTGGSWDYHTLLAPEDLSMHAYFGHTVAFSGEVGLVSAYSSTGSGQVYRFERDSRSGDWLLQTVLLPTDPDNGFNDFGASLRIVPFPTSNVPNSAIVDAVVAVIGAPGDNTVGEMSGALYVFAADETDTETKQWHLKGKITSNDSAAYSSFGQSVAVLGKHVMVGAELADSPASTVSGAVYVETNLLVYLTSTPSTDDGDDVPTTPPPTVLETVRNALLSTVGILLMAFIPAASIALITVLVITRGHVFSKLPDSDEAGAGSAVDAEGHAVNKDGEVIILPKSENGVAIGPSYSYFVNPLQRMARKKSNGRAATSEKGLEMEDQQRIRSDSVDLSMVDRQYVVKNFHASIPSPASGNQIYPSPIEVPRLGHAFLESIVGPSSSEGHTSREQTPGSSGLKGSLKVSGEEGWSLHTGAAGAGVSSTSRAV